MIDLSFITGPLPSRFRTCGSSTGYTSSFGVIKALSPCSVITACWVRTKSEMSSIETIQLPPYDERLPTEAKLDRPPRKFSAVRS